MIGKVESYSAAKNWGFIRGDDMRRYYVSKGNINRESIPSRALSVGCSVEFSTGEGNKALNVRYI